MEITLVTVFLAVIVGEAVLLSIWSPFYFRAGIPIFRHEVKVFASGAESPTPEELAGRLERSRHPPLVFRRMDGDRFAFREGAGRKAIGRFGYTPVMHGRLDLDRERSVVRVVGLANWSPLLFATVVVLFFVAWPGPWWFALIFLGGFAGLLAWIYSIQRRRFREAATAAAQLWSGAIQAS